MFLLVGLGNPGPRYQWTRHNFGFLLIDKIAETRALPEDAWLEKNDSLYARTHFKESEVLLVKPQTFMNLSGKSVQAWMQFFKIPKERLLVLVDDVAIPFGTLRLRPGGSDGGHNGLKHIDSVCGNGYARLRLGIGDAASPVPMERFVLEKFSVEEQKRLPTLLGQMTECVETFLEKGVQETMNLWNGKKL